ncbi:hypothetical protein EYC84_005537 [Monilinia fructicola]|uniref:Uncharacterized protein n=1 Tax=Monilinia fructicola TaxID=38448 RepID=A0A5M9JZB3_MONFR|nr:hypothetical protein EYC84_005537 [Monilinia fructicola]
MRPRDSGHFFSLHAPPLNSSGGAVIGGCRDGGTPGLLLHLILIRLWMLERAVGTLLGSRPFCIVARLRPRVWRGRGQCVGDAFSSWNAG